MISDAFFVLEGPDGSGKSTLAQELQRVYNIPYFHLTYYKDPLEHQRQFDEIEQMLDLYLSGKATSGVLFDRFIFSTQVYEHVFHNGSTITNYVSIMDKLNAVARKCSMGVNIIFTLPRPKERYLKAFELLSGTREELYTDIEKMSNVYDAYDELYKELSKMKLDFNVSEFNYFFESDIRNEGGHKWTHNLFKH